MQETQGRGEVQSSGPGPIPLGGQKTAHLSYCHGSYRHLRCLSLSLAGSAGIWLGKQVTSASPTQPPPALPSWSQQEQSPAHPEWPPTATQRLVLTLQAQYGSRARMQSAQERYFMQSARGS